MFQLQPVTVLVLATAVLWLGTRINRRVGVLARYAIPAAVTGGVVCSVFLAGLDLGLGVHLEFDLRLRDVLLLAFFASIGLGAKISDLKRGGRTLAILFGITVAFLVAQNLMGMLVSTLLGYPARRGLLAGSISFAGGHGTAISWGKYAEAAGHVGVIELGVAFATIGLIAGGLLGGPLGTWLIKRHELAGPKEAETVRQPLPRRWKITQHGVLNALFMLALSIALGRGINLALTGQGVVLPGFVTAMSMGVLLGNLADHQGWRVSTKGIELLGAVCLSLFLSMSLMSMDIVGLAPHVHLVAVALVAQVLLALGVSIFIVFPAAGRDYEAAVLSSGFLGVVLGATPIGMANMSALAGRYQPAPKAFIVLPLLGAFFLDMSNAVIIQIMLESVGGVN